MGLGWFIIPTLTAGVVSYFLGADVIFSASLILASSFFGIAISIFNAATVYVNYLYKNKD